MRQWWPSASSSRSPIRAASASSSSLEAQPLVEVVDVQQRRVAALERDRASARGSPSRCAIASASALSASARSCGVAKWRRSTSAARSWTASRMVLGAERGQRLLEQRDPLAVDHAGLGVAAGEAERGLGQRVAVAALAGELCGGGERLARRRVAGAQLGGAELEQDVEPRASRSARAGSARPPPRRRARPPPARRRRARSRTAFVGPRPRRSGRRARPGSRRRPPPAPRRCAGAGARAGSRSGRSYSVSRTSACAKT